MASINGREIYQNFGGAKIFRWLLKLKRFSNVSLRKQVIVEIGISHKVSL
jgi:hypothetical protein